MVGFTCQLVHTQDVSSFLYLLEQLLVRFANAPFPYGLYSKYRLYPITTDANKRYSIYRSDGEYLETLSLKELEHKTAYFSKEFIFSDTEGVEYSGDEISFTPITPVRAFTFWMSFIKYTIEDKSKVARIKLGGKRLSDPYAEALKDLLNMPVDKVIEVYDELLNKISDITIDHSSSIVEMALKYEWHDLIVDNDGNQIHVFTLGDHRINEWHRLTGYAR